MPLARLGKELRPGLPGHQALLRQRGRRPGRRLPGYEKLYDTLRAAEALSDDEYQVVVKWSKIEAKGGRSYQRCYGAPFILQISGSGLVAPCGMLFNERYKKFHIGNICEQSFKEIWSSDRYWEVMNYLASPRFNAQKMCGTLCLQHKVNETLDGYRKGLIQLRRPEGPPPQHLDFI